MHELSIADSIVSIACDHAAGRRVTEVEVKIGYLRQVVPTSLEFAFELVAHGTPVEGARLVLDEVPAAGACRDCGQECELASFPLVCPACGSLDLELLRGEELLVDSLELENELATTGGAR